MIRVNLFAGSDAADQRTVWLRRAAIGAAGLLLVAVVFGGGYMAIRALSGPRHTAAATKAGSTTGTAAPAGATDSIVRTPTTIQQRIAAEMQFGRMAMDLLADAVPQGIRPLTQVEIDNFSVVRIQGTAGSKGAVRTVFNAIRARGVKLRPPPNTSIASENGEFVFTLDGKVSFPLNMRDPFVDSAIARLPSPDTYESEVARFERFAEDAQVQIRGGLRYTSTQKAGPYRRYAYRMDGTATFDDFVQLTRDLYAGRVTCSIGEATLKSDGSALMTFNATVYFTAKE